VPVVRSRVRVRKAPVDGEIIGFISAPQKVRLIDREGEWCLVKTKRGNVGWMVCWGLGLGQGATKKPSEEGTTEKDAKAPSAAKTPSAARTSNAPNDK
jgi:uncharacterized protein YgiM (DUF1202 family)